MSGIFRLFILSTLFFVFSVTSAFAQEQRNYQPDFDCARASNTDSIATLLCHDSNSAKQELIFDQAYYALRHQVGKDGWKALKQELVGDFQGLNACIVPGDGSQVPPPVDPNCYAQHMQQITASYRQRLQGAALEEANRPIDQHIALQQKLIDLGYLPVGSVADGVYGEGTRDAIRTWQRVTHRTDPDGFLSNADANALLPVVRSVEPVPQVDAPMAYTVNDGLESEITSVPADVKALIRHEFVLDDRCRGGSGDAPATQRACDARDTLVDQIKSRGWCYGPDDAIEADKHWLLCSQSTSVASAPILTNQSAQQAASAQVTPYAPPVQEQPQAGPRHSDAGNDGVDNKQQDTTSGSSMALSVVLVLFLVFLGLAFYFIPTIVAFWRGHSYKWVILAINVFAGWTGLGWLTITVWSIWPAEKSIVDPVVGNVTGLGTRNAGDTMGAATYGKERGYRQEVSVSSMGTKEISEQQLSQLARLGSLKQSGILTDIEFEVEKARILRPYS